MQSHQPHSAAGQPEPPTGKNRHPSRRRTLAGGLTVVALVAGGAGLATSAQAEPSQPDFGPNVTILDPSMSVDSINTTLEGLSHEEEFSTNRHAVFFKPGTYGSAAGQDDPSTATGIINSEVGYYTSIAGLGSSPDDVQINGALHVEAVQSDPNQPWNSQSPGSLTRFWRSLSNVAINPIQRPAGEDATRAIPEGVADPHTMRWAVSQAAPLRRVDIQGDLTVFGRFGAYASGGYMADSKVDGTMITGSQQQWFTRDSDIGTAPVAVWNTVYSGVANAPASTAPGPDAPNATTPLVSSLPTTPVSRDIPFLYLDGDDYKVFVPKARTDASGTNWSTSADAGQSIPIGDFYIAKPGDSAATINAALGAGKNLLVTPGVYNLDAPIDVARAGTVVLGLGYATLVPTAGTAAIEVGDVAGVKIAGITVDAGAIESPVLVKVGTDAADSSSADAADPTTLSDVFVRVGGPHPGKATTSIEVNSDHVLLDHIWAWRADHGDGVAWDQNTGDHGLVVNGDDVTALGLFVEHFQKAQTVWNGNGGQTVFYQSELPYDPPSQAAWSDGDRNGYASYQVAPGVTSHTATGLGVYSFFNQGVDIRLASAIQAPKAAGVTFTNMVTVFLNGSGGIEHIINDAGLPAVGGFASPGLLSYPPADTAAPVASITATPAAADGKRGWYVHDVSLAVTATDDFASPTTQVSVDGGRWKTVTGPVVLGDGRHTVKARAKDAAGNVSPVVRWSGKVDSIAPTAVSTLAAGTRTVTLTASDPGGSSASGVNSVQYRLGSTKAWTAYTAPIVIGNAATTVQYRATDAAGNTSALGSLAVPAKAASTVPLTVNARSQCVSGKASVAVYALNKAASKADIRLTTSFGDKKFTGVASGTAAYTLFATGATSIPAGTATVAGYTWVNGAASYSTYTVPYLAVDCAG